MLDLKGYMTELFLLGGFVIFILFLIGCSSSEELIVHEKVSPELLSYLNAEDSSTLPDLAMVEDGVWNVQVICVNKSVVFECLTLVDAEGVFIGALAKDVIVAQLTPIAILSVANSSFVQQVDTLVGVQEYEDMSGQGSNRSVKEKIQPNLLEKLNNMDDNTTLDVIVGCYDKLTMYRCKYLLDQQGSLHGISGFDSFSGSITKKNLLVIAEDPSISWIEENMPAVIPRNTTITTIVIPQASSVDSLNQTNCSIPAQISIPLQKILNSSNTSNDAVNVMVSCKQSEYCSDIVGNYGEIYDYFSSSKLLVQITKADVQMLACHQYIDSIKIAPILITT